MNGINMSTVTNYMLGSTQVNYIYCGSTLVWPLSTGTDYFYILADYHNYQPTESESTYVEFDLIEGQTLYYSYDQRSWSPVINETRVNAKHKYYPDKVSGPYSYSYNTITYRIALDNRSIVYLKGNLSSYLGTYNSYNVNVPMFQMYRVYVGVDPDTPTSTVTYSIGGNLLSLMYNTDNVHSFTNATNEAYNFYGAFNTSNGQYISDISELIFPNNTVPYCYGYMFGFPSPFTTAPELPATTLSEGAYYHMFDECYNLNDVTCFATDISATNCTTDWLYGAAATGTFTRDQNNTSWTIGTSGIPSGWTVVPPLAHDYSQDYLTFEALEAGTFTWTDTQNSNSISYSIDNGSTWSTLASGSSTPTIAANNKVLFKASGLTIANMYGIGTFSSSGRFNAMGNAMSLVYGDNFASQTTINSSYQLCKLFNNCTTLVDASNLILPATTLSDRCYYWMFRGCSSLTAAPELPATTVYNRSYYNMFANCSSLTTAPDLPATTIDEYCYGFMFQNCTSLTTAPSILPATTLATSCYSSMFQGCTSLTTAPELPATILATRCYETMFNGCTSLNYIKCLATDISAYYATNNWVVNVAASGTFVKANGTAAWNVSSAGNGIPSGWTVQNAS